MVYDIKHVDVYTEFGGNVTLNCSSSRYTQWQFVSEILGRPRVISENKFINPAFNGCYKVTDGDTYNLKIVNATNFTEGRYSCYTTSSKAGSSHDFYLHLKGWYTYFTAHVAILN